jgi:hypothetical protein
MPHLQLTTKLTKAEKLLAILADGEAHTTRELVRRVGHAFGTAVFRLRRNGHHIVTSCHPTKRWQRNYQLVDVRVSARKRTRA